MTRFRPLILPLLTALLAQSASAAENWWNKEWTQRQPVTVDSKETGYAGGATVLVRLSDANFQFDAAKDDGSDLRFIGEDGKTVLPHQIEKYDGLMHECLAWVKVPAAKGKFTLYYGNQKASSEAAFAYDADTALVYHFAERGTAAADSTVNKNNAGNAGVVSEGALVGSGLRLAGGEPVAVPPTPTLEWKANQALTWSVWVKPAALRPRAVVFSRDNFRVLLDQGVPVAEVNGVRSSSGGTPLAAGVWSHIAFVAEGASIKVYANGILAGSVAAGVPASNTALAIGGLPAGAAAGDTERFTGEMDELQISTVARSEGWLKFAALNQGASEAAGKAVVVGEVEGAEGGGKESEAAKQLGLFKDIAGNMQFDGWIAIGVCAIMIAAGWTVAVKKFLYLGSIQKGSREFQRQWKTLSSDLTALDHTDTGNVSSFGGQADEKTQSQLKKSPLYHLYHIGSEEIRHRIARDKTRTQGLSGRSIEAIRASLDAGLVHENHRLTKGLVFLTMSIAGGPYVGLLGTVVGVMMTFAVIARSGEVDVNSIAPGIASALLATVVGLVVAIPALFIYSYLNSRIKDNMGTMQVFIDEFIAKMAEFYPPAGENSPHAPHAPHAATQAHANAHPLPRVPEPV